MRNPPSLRKAVTLTIISKLLDPGATLPSSPSRFINFHSSQVLSIHYMQNTAGEVTGKSPLFLELTFQREQEIIIK